MSIRCGDFRLSGRIWRSLDESARSIVGVEEALHVEAATLIRGDERAPIPLVTPTIDLSTDTRIEVRLRMDGRASPLILWLTRGDEHEPPNTAVDALLFLDEIRDGGPTPEVALRAFAHVMAALAAKLDASWLHLVDEDDDRFMLGRGFSLPSICGVYQRGIIAELEAPLRAAGAVIEDQTVAGYQVVWVEPLAILLASVRASSPTSVHALLRDRLVRT